MDHPARARALAQLAVLPQIYRRVAYISIGINEGSYRRVGVERFTTTKLLLLFLQIAIGDIEADRVTENVIECIVRAHILRASTDHDSQFSFKICLVLGKRDFDHALMWQQRTPALNQINGAPISVRFISAM